jgi:DNA-binding SARP family transcriptional activator
VQGAQPPIQVLVLGPTSLRVDGVEVPVASAPQRVLLARLALAAGTVVSDAVLSEALWPAEQPDAALANLQTYVSKLRGRVGRTTLVRAPGTGSPSSPTASTPCASLGW